MNFSRKYQMELYIHVNKLLLLLTRYPTSSTNFLQRVGKALILKFVRSELLEMFVSTSLIMTEIILSNSSLSKHKMYPHCTIDTLGCFL